MRQALGDDVDGALRLRDANAVAEPAENEEAPQIAISPRAIRCSEFERADRQVCIHLKVANMPWKSFGVTPTMVAECPLMSTCFPTTGAPPNRFCQYA